jgi:hypothetical protein
MTDCNTFCQPQSPPQPLAVRSQLLECANHAIRIPALVAPGSELIVVVEVSSSADADGTNHILTVELYRGEEQRHVWAQPLPVFAGTICFAWRVHWQNDPRRSARLRCRILVDDVAATDLRALVNGPRVDAQGRFVAPAMDAATGATLLACESCVWSQVARSPAETLGVERVFCRGAEG